MTTHPIGIGSEGWATPTGEATVTGKARDPVWYVPASIRKEHAERGDPLPSKVLPGPDNPLGKFVMTLSIPGYLIHGTNKPAGVGMRSSHGCVRLYPEDVEALFARVGNARALREPTCARGVARRRALSRSAPAARAERPRPRRRGTARAGSGVEACRQQRAGRIDETAVQQIVAEQRGIPFPVLRGSRTPEQYLAAARIVENTVPVEQTASTAEVDRAATSSSVAPKAP